MCVLWATGLQPRPQVSAPMVRALLPVALFHTIGHVSACVSFSQMAVSFAHVVKSAEPVLSVVLAQAILGETYPYYVWLSLLPIIAGCSLAAVKEVRRGRGWLVPRRGGGAAALLCGAGGLGQGMAGLGGLGACCGRHSCCCTACHYCAACTGVGGISQARGASSEPSHSSPRLPPLRPAVRPAQVSFAWSGFNNAMISNLGMVLRNIYSKKLLGDFKVHPPPPRGWCYCGALLRGSASAGHFCSCAGSLGTAASLAAAAAPWAEEEGLLGRGRGRDLPGPNHCSPPTAPAPAPAPAPAHPPPAPLV